MDFEKFSDPELNYFDIEILQFFKQFGTPHFANLDIWDINWEYKRQLALDYEVEGIPESTIHDPVIGNNDCIIPTFIVTSKIHYGENRKGHLFKG